MEELLWQKFIDHQQEKIPDFPREAVLLWGICGVLSEFENWLKMNEYLKEDNQ